MEEVSKAKQIINFMDEINSSWSDLEKILYICDICGHQFQIHAHVSFMTSGIENHDFKYNYESPLYSEDRIELVEND